MILLQRQTLCFLPIIYITYFEIPEKTLMTSCSYYLLALLSFTFILLPLSADARELSREEVLQHWEWLSKETGGGAKVPREQLLEYYDKNLSDFDLDRFEWDPPQYDSVNLAQALFGLSTAARRRGDPREDEFLRHANRFAELEIQSEHFNRKTVAPHSHLKYLEDAREDREFELVFQEAHKGNERVRKHLVEKGFDKEYFEKGGSFDPKNFVDNNKVVADVAAELGDFSRQLKVERLEIERLESIVERSWGTSDLAKLDSQSGFLIVLKYPDLALALAKCGKGDEAADILDKYDQFMKKAAADPSAKNVRTFGSSFEANRHLAVAETNLLLGRPEAARENLKAVSISFEKGAKDFLKFLSGGTKGPNKALDGVRKGFEKRKRELEKQQLEIEIACLWQLRQFKTLAERLDHFSSLLEDLPATHPKVVNLRQQQLWTDLALGDRASAASGIQEFVDDQTLMIEEAFRYASERQRLALMEQLDPFSLLIATDRTDLLFPGIVSLKGIVLDSILEDRKVLRKGASTEMKGLISLLKAERTRLAKAQVAANREAVTLARNEIERLEVRLSQVSSFQVKTREGLEVTVAQVQSALSPDEMILEYIRYQHLDELGSTKDHYGVALIAQQNTPIWIPLGEAAEIDAKIATLKNHMDPSRGEFDDAGVESVLKALYSHLLAPAEEALGNATKLYLSPDSELGGLAFSVLLDSGGTFAANKWELAFVSTSRDLLKETAEPSGENSLFIVANPDFESPADNSAEGVDLASRAIRFDVRGIPPLAPLPGTQLEMDAISAVAERLNATVTSLSGAGARESALGQWDNSPTYLHFATHGLVLPAVSAVTRNRAEQASGSFATADNALERSMLALAGASGTIAQWKEGIAPDSRDDGLLNAAEVAGLNLDSTWVTVLSACDTGTGEALSGEGIFGLRRGFLMAGADHLVMTFWPIADQQTVEIMTDFYVKLGEGQHPATALYRAQVDKLNEWRKELGLGVAVYLAGPFALSTTGSSLPR